MVNGTLSSSGPPTVTVDIAWDEPMDTGAVPPLTVWEFLVDGVPTPASGQSWFAGNILRLTYAGSDPTVTGFLRLLTTSVNLRSSVGALAKAPQVVQFFP